MPDFRVADIKRPLAETISAHLDGSQILQRQDNEKEASALPSPQEKERELPNPQEEQKSIFEAMQEARQKAEEQRKKLKLPSSIRYGDAPLEAYARLARAKTQQEVSSAAGYTRRRLMQLKAALRQDSDNKTQIKSAITQLTKALFRASKKKKDLQREKLVEKQRERAIDEERKREAIRLRIELQRKKTNRYIREKAYSHEAEIERRMQEQRAMTETELKIQAQQLPVANASVSAEGYPAVSEPSAEVSLEFSADA